MTIEKPARRAFTQQTAWLGAAAATGLLLPRPAFAGEQISVTHWRILMHGLPYAVAMKKGFFSDAGVDITGILSSKGGATTMRNVLSEGLPYGEVSVAAVVAAAKLDSSINQGSEIKIVNAGVNSIGDALWVTLPNSSIKSVKDFEGRKIGFTSAKSVTDMLLIMALEKSKIKLDTVVRMPTGGYLAGLKALDQGTVEAVPVMEPIWATVQSKYRPVFYVRDVLPSMTQTVGVTTSTFAAMHGSTLRSIVAGRRRGVQFIYANPKETAGICAQLYELEPPVAAAVVNHLAKLRYWSEGSFDVGALNTMVRGLKVVGEIDKDVDWPKLIDPGFLPNDLRKLYLQENQK